ncbi:MAG: 4Fe-4S binding protein [Syntrophaceticus sp.]|nr:4Fe-4S binding protein [Syntrophaceticus sp.]
MNRKLRSYSQLLFLLLFLILVIQGKSLMWMSVLPIAAILTVMFGRFYCGWICPINTLMEISNWIGRNLNIQTKQIPELIKSGIFAFILLGLPFLIVFAEVELSFIVLMAVLGFLTALRYKPIVWHRYLCPFGLVFRIPGRFSIFRMQINDSCSGCRACQGSCSGAAISNDELKSIIDPRHCLVCLACQEKCRQGAVTYGSVSKQVPRTPSHNSVEKNRGAR